MCRCTPAQTRSWSTLCAYICIHFNFSSFSLHFSSIRIFQSVSVCIRWRYTITHKNDRSANGIFRFIHFRSMENEYRFCWLFFFFILFSSHLISSLRTKYFSLVCCVVASTWRTYFREKLEEVIEYISVLCRYRVVDRAQCSALLSDEQYANMPKTCIHLYTSTQHMPVAAARWWTYWTVNTHTTWYYIFGIMNEWMQLFHRLQHKCHRIRMKMEYRNGTWM